MRKTATVAVCLLFVVGGCGLDPAAGRSVTARSTCHDVNAPDGFIDTIFDLVRIARDSGETESESTIAIWGGCLDNSGQCPDICLECRICSVAIIRVVYAE